jgi:hypothetical protein
MAMPIPGVQFKIRGPAAAAATTRADVAVFAGLIGRRPTPLPSLVRATLANAGWREGGGFPVSEARLAALLGVPVAVESWTDFDALFDWRSRAPIPESEVRLPCPLGLAVRQFFLQGGVRAWILRCGDPLPLSDSSPDADAFSKMQLNALGGPVGDGEEAQPILPGFLGRSKYADPLDSATWQGAALIYAIADAAMLLLPDLPDLAAGPAPTLEPAAEPPGPPEEFRPCAPAVPEDAPEAREARPLYRAPRLGANGFRLWSSALRHALQMLGRPRGPEHRRDVMLVSSLPIPGTGPQIPPGSEQWPLGVLSEKGNAGSKDAPLALFDADAIGNARLQLGYPWMATPDAAACPEGLQSPEGALAGMFARTALEQGAFRSAAGKTLASPALLVPRIAGSEIARGFAGRADWLGDRLCIFRERQGKIELISDATVAEDRAWRKGGVSRLIGTLLRACRHIGDDFIFEPAGPAVWAQLAARITAVLEQLRALGAFDGLSAPECYRVTCDRTTMTDADIDAGRVRCEVIVNPASPIERIIVTLALLEPVQALTQEAA